MNVVNILVALVVAGPVVLFLVCDTICKAQDKVEKFKARPKKVYTNPYTGEPQ